MPILDTNPPHNNNLFLGENEYGQRFYRRGSNVYAEIRGQTRWYCTWASWVTLGYQMAGILLKKVEE